MAGECFSLFLSIVDVAEAVPGIVMPACYTDRRPCKQWNAVSNGGMANVTSEVCESKLCKSLRAESRTVAHQAFFEVLVGDIFMAGQRVRVSATTPQT